MRIPNNTTETFSADIVDPISTDDFNAFIKVYSIVFTLSGVLGAVANGINIYVFSRMDLTDGMTVNFLSLAVADLGVTFFAAATGVGLLLDEMQKQWSILFGVSPLVVISGAAATMTSFMSGSILLTTFLAVQRCCCVVLPFQFGQLFTRKTNLGVVLAILAVVLFIEAGYASLYGFEWRPSGGTNGSTLQLVSLPHRDSMLYYLVAVQLFCMTMGCEATVLVCLMVMLYGLRRSATFRGKSKTNIVSETSTSSELDTRSSRKVTSSKGGQDQSEVRVMKTVLLISAVFVSCNSSSVVLAILQMYVREFDPYGRLGNSYSVVLSIMSMVQVVNSSINLCIYHESSTKFKKSFKECFGRI